MLNSLSPWMILRGTPDFIFAVDLHCVLLAKIQLRFSEFPALQSCRLLWSIRDMYEVWKVEEKLLPYVFYVWRIGLGHEVLLLLRHVITGPLSWQQQGLYPCAGPDPSSVSCISGPGKCLVTQDITFSHRIAHYWDWRLECGARTTWSSLLLCGPFIQVSILSHFTHFMSMFPSQPPALKTSFTSTRHRNNDLT